MAPEVQISGKYNTKVDVYSFAIVLWEMLSQKKAFSSYSDRDLRIKVWQGGERPPMSASWPKSLQDLLQCSWTESVEKRWNMTRVMQELTVILQELEEPGVELSLKEHGPLVELECIPCSPVAVQDAWSTVGISKAAEILLPQPSRVIVCDSAWQI
jgi:serine/threonine protein kinase